MGNKVRIEISNEKNPFNIEEVKDKENLVHINQKTLDSEISNVKTEGVNQKIDNYRESNKGSDDMKPINECHEKIFYSVLLCFECKLLLHMTTYYCHDSLFYSLFNRK